MDNKELKEQLLNQIWFKIKEIDVDIKYTSLLHEMCVAKNFYGYLIKIVLVIIGAAPLITDLLIAHDIVDAKNIYLLIVLVLIIILPVVFMIFGIDEKSLLSLDKRIKKLMELNKTLLSYSAELDKIWREVNSDKRPVAELQYEFDTLVQKHICDEHLHDELTGSINSKIADKAREESEKYLKNKYYG